MYPAQNYPVYPIQSQGCNPYLLPQVNAVKIDIHNPKAYGGVDSHGKINPVSPQQEAGYYGYPMAPIYNMPTVAQYNTPGSYPAPVLNTATQAVPQIIPQNAQQPIQSQNAAGTIAAQPSIQVPPVTAAPMPVPAMNPVAPMPMVPPPAVNAPVTQNVNINPAIPAAVVDKPENTSVAPVAPVAAQNETNADVDVNTLLTGLSSNNQDDQTAAIQKIAELAQTNPAAAKTLLNEQIFGKLVNVINADTSKLEGPTGKDNKTLSPLEKAEINKQFAVYTLAILQKNFRDEINKEMKKNNLPDIAINDLPYIKEGIVNNLKDNPNPTIREACLSALNYVGRPEDKEVLKVLYDISAKHDASPDVRKAASECLAKIPA